jgi:parvulin-like peptidyl-prolyl isomerase
MHRIHPIPSPQALFLSVFFSLLLLAGCDGAGPAVTETPPGQPSGTAASQAPQPSPTTVEIAAVVNNQVISLPQYEAHLVRYQDAQAQVGTLLATEDVSGAVIKDLINRLLLSQAARAAGFSADETMVDERTNNLIQQIGGAEAFESWLAANHYTAESFRTDLAIEIEGGWMREQVINEVPESAEQVLAREVLFLTEFDALRVFTQLENGASFDTIVANNDPQQFGYLGWFSRGYLLEPEIEAAAFGLQPGQYSEVIQTRLGYHIVQTLVRDPNRPLSQAARLKLQSAHLDQWLAQQYDQSQIEIQLP